jgi:hypothetical protein
MSETRLSPGGCNYKYEILDVDAFCIYGTEPGGYDFNLKLYELSYCSLLKNDRSELFYIHRITREQIFIFNDKSGLLEISIDEFVDSNHCFDLSDYDEAERISATKAVDRARKGRAERRSMMIADGAYVILMSAANATIPKFFGHIVPDLGFGESIEVTFYFDCAWLFATEEEAKKTANWFRTEDENKACKAIRAADAIRLPRVMLKSDGRYSVE